MLCTWVAVVFFLLPIAPVHGALDTPYASEKSCLALKTKHAADSLNDVTQCDPKTLIPSLGLGMALSLPPCSKSHHHNHHNRSVFLHGF